jgi:hypothetical protein
MASIAMRASPCGAAPHRQAHHQVSPAVARAFVFDGGIEMGYAELGLSLLAVLALTWAVMEWSR